MTSKIEALREALRRLLAQHKADGTLPTSGRFLYYELVAAGVISKHALGPVKPGCKAKREPHQDVSLACEFRRNPAGDSDLMSATVPI